MSISRSPAEDPGAAAPRFEGLGLSDRGPRGSPGVRESQGVARESTGQAWLGQAGPTDAPGQRSAKQRANALPHQLVRLRAMRAREEWGAVRAHVCAALRLVDLPRGLQPLAWSSSQGRRGVSSVLPRAPIPAATRAPGPGQVQGRARSPL